MKGGHVPLCPAPLKSAPALSPPYSQASSLSALLAM